MSRRPGVWRTAGPGPVEFEAVPGALNVVVGPGYLEVTPFFLVPVHSSSDRLRILYALTARASP